MKKRRNFDFEESNQQFWPCGYQLLLCNEMWQQEKMKQWRGIEQQEILNKSISSIETLNRPRGWLVSLTFPFWQNKLEMHTWKFRRRVRDNQREVLYKKFASHWRSSRKREDLAGSKKVSESFQAKKCWNSQMKILAMSGEWSEFDSLQEYATQ